MSLNHAACRTGKRNTGPIWQSLEQPKRLYRSSSIPVSLFTQHRHPNPYAPERPGLQWYHGDRGSQFDHCEGFGNVQTAPDLGCVDLVEPGRWMNDVERRSNELGSIGCRPTRWRYRRLASSSARERVNQGRPCSRYWYHRDQPYRRQTTRS